MAITAAMVKELREMTGAGHGYCKKRQKWTRRYLLSTAVSSKKGDFNTPSVFSFFKKKTAA